MLVVEGILQAVIVVPMGDLAGRIDVRACAPCDAPDWGTGPNPTDRGRRSWGRVSAGVEYARKGAHI